MTAWELASVLVLALVSVEVSAPVLGSELVLEKVAAFFPDGPLLLPLYYSPFPGKRSGH
jgi:hypothetical protein